ncbi:MAG: hypothetical protein ACK55Z_33140, partial [bacterium]
EIVPGLIVEEENASGPIYEGLFASFKLLAASDKLLTSVLINDMNGDYKVSSIDNKFFNKINPD